ncbi:MAG: hypothetical protein AB1782_03850, partial [Cyanobacteriota bacterium]
MIFVIMHSTINTVKTMHSMPAGDIISRSWRLYRLNFSQLILYALIPTVLIVVSKLLMNFFYATGENKEALQIGCCCLWPIGIILMFISMYISVIFNYGLSKTVFNIIIGKDFHYQAIIESIKQNLVKLLLFSLIIAIEILAFAFFDFILFFVCYIAFIFPLTALTIVTGDNAILFVCVIFLILLFIVGIFYFSVIVVQILFCQLQIVIFATDKQSILYSINKSIRVIFRAPLKCVLFAFCLTILAYTLILFFQYPIAILIGFIAITIGQVPESYYPLTFIIISTIW